MRKSAPVRFGSIKARPPPALAGMRIGLIGGSFDPPHEGHRLISQIALRRLGVSQVWWLVTPGNPLKDTAAPASLADRLALCRALKRDRRSKVTSFESGLATAFSAATISFLKARFPATNFVWIMGADNLIGFHHWWQWREIFMALPIAVVDRPGCHFRALSSEAAAAFGAARIPEARARRLAGMKPPAWTLLTGPLSGQSSTALRRGAAG